MLVVWVKGTVALKAEPTGLARAWTWGVLESGVVVGYERGTGGCGAQVTLHLQLAGGSQASFLLSDASSCTDTANSVFVSNITE